MTIDVNAQVFGSCIWSIGRPLVEVIVSVHGDGAVAGNGTVVGSVALGSGRFLRANIISKE